jgi:DNA-binding response OmpR family regulator
MKILLIEDDLQICEVIQKYFGSKGAEIIAVNDGSNALSVVRASISDYSIVLLDIMLPDADGFTICREIRKQSNIPVLFITARGREEDILHGYDLGCDDYIVKPFLMSALYAKCRAIVKRSENQQNDLLVCGEISLDTHKLVCCVNGKEVELTPKCFAILRYLMEHQGWVTDRETLLDKVWGRDYFGIDRVVDNHIKKLRKALGTAGKQVHTVVGRGYKLSDE